MRWFVWLYASPPTAASMSVVSSKFRQFMVLATPHLKSGRPLPIFSTAALPVSSRRRIGMPHWNDEVPMVAELPQPPVATSPCV